jgi:hypothetical protein
MSASERQVSCIINDTGCLAVTFPVAIGSMISDSYYVIKTQGKFIILIQHRGHTSVKISICLKYFRTAGANIRYIRNEIMQIKFGKCMVQFSSYLKF